MRVLFVEDDAMNRRVVKDMLTIVGVTMEEAEDAEAGLRMVEADDYDAILMDLRMPGMDGLTAVRHIRARPDGKARTPIIVITADTGVDLRATCFAEGANEVLGKPVAMEALFDALGNMLAGNGDLMI
jgi:CheY-like chemotaxis protein